MGEHNKKLEKVSTRINKSPAILTDRAIQLHFCKDSIDGCYGCLPLHCIWTGTWVTNNPIYDLEILSRMASWINSFHIYGFTLVSKYLFYFLKHEKGKYSRFLSFAANKAKLFLRFTTLQHAYVSILL